MTASDTAADEAPRAGPVARARTSVAALEVLDHLRETGQPATEADREVLCRWAGWGPMANAFEPDRAGGWAEIGDKIEWLLDPYEQVEARKATPNAFYTPPEVAQVCWQIARDLGFEGGRVLEPGCGAGVFMGHAPTDLASSVSWIGIERDPTTARIAQAIYPGAEILNSKLEKAKLPTASVDAVLGNVPFADTLIFDPNAPESVTRNLHNYCIWRSAQTLRPGGVAVLITSRYTLDSQDRRSREALYANCDLVSAIRLPNVAWRSGGTEPVADILVLRRRRPGEEPGTDVWLDVETMPSLGTEVNKLFLAHPHLVVGEHNRDHAAQFGRVLRVDSREGTDWRSELTTVAQRVARGALGLGLGWNVDAAPGPINTENTVLADADGRKEGSFHLIDGQAHEVFEGRLQPVTSRKRVRGSDEYESVPLKGKELNELKGLIGLRDTTLAVLDTEERAVTHERVIRDAADRIGELRRSQDSRTPADRNTSDAERDLADAEAALAETESELGSLRGELNRRYDDYQGTYGFLNRCTIVEGKPDEETGLATIQRRRPRMGGFRTDPDYFAVLALEEWDDDSRTAEKSAIFSRRVNRAPRRQDRADNVGEAIALCLDEHGRLHLPTIARLLDVDPGAVPEALGNLAYVEPTSGQWFTAEEYLSGNVRIKLDHALAAAEAEPDSWTRNVDALREVQPIDLGPGDIHAPLGAPWIPTTDVREFLVELLNTEHETTVRREPLTSTWEVKIDKSDKRTTAATVEWGTDRVHAARLVELALNGQTPDVKDTTGGGNTAKAQVRNIAATTAAEEKQRQIISRFVEWVWESPERADRLAERYNRLFNSTVLRRYDGSHLTFPGLAEGFDPYPHQRDMVYQAISTQTALCGHAVGGGKTTIMFMTAMKLRQLGLVTKPMIVVPKHLLEQTAREGKQRFPGAKILVADENDMSDARSRKLFAARCATGDWDAVVITHSAFTRVPMHERNEADYLADLAAQYRASLAAVMAGESAEEDEFSKVGRRTKQIEKLIDSLEARTEYLLHHDHDDGIRFEHLGVDHLLVDEFHYFKNLLVPCHTEGFSMSNSKRATDMDMKLTWLRSRYDRVATFYTGTAVSNSLLELYIVLHYLMPERLEEMGIDSPDAWASWCVQFETNVEIGPDGVTPRLNRRPSTFKNVRELLMVFAERSDIRTQEDLGLKVPQVEHINVVSKASPTQRAYIQVLARRADSLKGFRVRKGGDNMLKVCTDGRKVAVDPALVGLKDRHPGKIDNAVDNVSRIFHETADVQFPADDKHAVDSEIQGTFQIVFCDLGTPGSERGEQVYGKVRDGLVAQGLPRNRIRFIHDANSDAQKAALFADCRSGKVSVLIGSTDKLGVGTNIQSRAVALHHIDAPWRPADVEQREGRVRRPGNRMRALQEERVRRLAAGDAIPASWPEHVRIFRYVTEGSFDGYMWQTLERKARFIAQVLSGKVAAGVREIDDIGDATLSFAEVKALATGNPMLMDLAKVKAEVARLSSLSASHTRTQRRLENDIAREQRAIRNNDTVAAALEGIHKAAEHAVQVARQSQDQALDGTSDMEDVTPWTTRDDKTLAQDKDVDAGLAVLAAQALKTKRDSGTWLLWRGLRVGFDLRYDDWRQQILSAVINAGAWPNRGEHRIEVNVKWLAKGQRHRFRQAITGAVETAADRAGDLREANEEAGKRIESARAQLGKPFEHAADLHKARERLSAIDAEMRKATETNRLGNPQVVDAEDGTDVDDLIDELLDSDGHDPELAAMIRHDARESAADPPRDGESSAADFDSQAATVMSVDAVEAPISALSEVAVDTAEGHSHATVGPPRRSVPDISADVVRAGAGQDLEQLGLTPPEAQWLHRRLVALAQDISVRDAERTVPETTSRFVRSALDLAMSQPLRAARSQEAGSVDSVGLDVARRFADDREFAARVREVGLEQVRDMVTRDLVADLRHLVDNLLADLDLPHTEQDADWICRWITAAAAAPRMRQSARVNDEHNFAQVLDDFLVDSAAVAIGGDDPPSHAVTGYLLGHDAFVAQRWRDLARHVVYDIVNERGAHSPVEQQNTAASAQAPALPVRALAAAKIDTEASDDQSTPQVGELDTVLEGGVAAAEHDHDNTSELVTNSPAAQPSAVRTLTLHYSFDRGVMLLGTDRGEGIADLLRPDRAGWKWRRVDTPTGESGAWLLPKTLNVSRSHKAMFAFQGRLVSRLSAAHRGLTEAGFAVQFDLHDLPESTVRRLNDWAARTEAPGAEAPGVPLEDEADRAAATGPADQEPPTQPEVSDELTRELDDVSADMRAELAAAGYTRQHRDSVADQGIDHSNRTVTTDPNLSRADEMTVLADLVDAMRVHRREFDDSVRQQYSAAMHSGLDEPVAQRARDLLSRADELDALARRTAMAGRDEHHFVIPRERGIMARRLSDGDLASTLLGFARAAQRGVSPEAVLKGYVPADYLHWRGARVWFEAGEEGVRVQLSCVRESGRDTVSVRESWLLGDEGGQLIVNALTDALTSAPRRADELRTELDALLRANDHAIRARDAAERQRQHELGAQFNAEAAAAYKAGDHERAFELLDQAELVDPTSQAQWEARRRQVRRGLNRVRSVGELSGERLAEKPNAGRATVVTQAQEPVLVTPEHQVVMHTRINAEAAAWFEQQLDKSQIPQDYLRDRIGDQDKIDYARRTIGLSIGYAPAGWTGLVDHLRAKGYRDQDMVDAGVASVSRNGPLYDQFRSRVVFGIRDSQGRVAGFIGRILPGVDGPKYLNTPATPLYDKSALLFGLHEQRDLVGHAQPVFVEGPMDVLALVAAADPQRLLLPMASCGTALTTRHLDAVDELVPADRRRVLALDGDDGGRKAGLKVAEDAVHRYPNLDFTTLPDGNDPAEWAKVAPFEEMIGAYLGAPHSRPAIDVLADARVESWGERLQWAEGRVDAARHVARLLAAFQPGRIAGVALRVATRLGIDPVYMAEYVADARHEGGEQPANRPPQLASTPAHSPQQGQSGTSNATPQGTSTQVEHGAGTAEPEAVQDDAAPAADAAQSGAVEGPHDQLSLIDVGESAQPDPPPPIAQVSTRTDVVRRVLGDAYNDKLMRDLVSVVMTDRSRGGFTTTNASDRLKAEDAEVHRRAVAAIVGRLTRGRKFDVERARIALDRLAAGDPSLPLNSLGHYVELQYPYPDKDSAAEDETPARGIVVEVTRETTERIRVVIERDTPSPAGATFATANFAIDDVIPVLDQVGQLPRDGESDGERPEADRQSRDEGEQAAAGDPAGEAASDPVAHQWSLLVEQAAGFGITVRTSYSGKSDLDLTAETILIAFDQPALNRLVDLAMRVAELAVRRGGVEMRPSREIPEQRSSSDRRAEFPRHAGVLDEVVSDPDDRRPDVGMFTGHLDLPMVPDERRQERDVLQGPRTDTPIYESLRAEFAKHEESDGPENGSTPRPVQISGDRAIQKDREGLIEHEPSGQRGSIGLVGNQPSKLGRRPTVSQRSTDTANDLVGTKRARTNR